LGEARHGLLDTLALLGVERLTDGARAFLDCSLESLVEDAWDGLPPADMVLQIPFQVQYSSRVLRACRALRENGFQLALRCAGAGPSAELLCLAHYIKVNASTLESPGWQALRSRLSGNPAILIADGIDTYPLYCKVRALGIKYFQASISAGRSSSQAAGFPLITPSSSVSSTNSSRIPSS
jgi:EAL and modified HD-GYP domain-containing signal transduction protein